MSLMLAALLVSRLPLVVQTYDSAGVSAAVLAQAQQRAGSTLAAAGVYPVWHPCPVKHVDACVLPPKGRELDVRIVKAATTPHGETLGFAFVDLEARAGRLATIYLDRVETLAQRAGIDPGELLGRAIAHEIGHLILGTNAHAVYGLMRASWRVDELRRNCPVDWMFSGREASEMRRNLDQCPSAGSVIHCAAKNDTAITP